MERPLKSNEYWHGGGYTGGPPLHSMYVTKDRVAAESYVDMARDRGIPNASLKRIRVNLIRNAPENVVDQQARKCGIDNEGNTPASAFDPELHGKTEVRNLVYALMGLGYDHATLDDIAYGVQREIKAVVLFRNTNPKLIETAMKTQALARLQEVRAAANKSQAKRFLQSLGLHPTSVAKDFDDYVSFNLAKDMSENEIANLISEGLKTSPIKRTRDTGLPGLQIMRKTKTLEWMWNVPGKGTIVFYPLLNRVGFADKPESIPMDGTA